MGRLDARLQGIGKGASLGFGVENNGFLIQPDLPLGFC